MANKNKTSIFNGETELVKVLRGQALFNIRDEKTGKAVGQITFYFNDWLEKNATPIGTEGRITNPTASQLPRRWILNQKSPEGR